jgi:hypothetical protein
VPQLPPRPTHPDLPLLSQAVTVAESASEAGGDALEIIGEHVDPDSILYAASHRSLHLTPPLGEITQELMRAKLSAMWIDGFLAALMFQKLKSEAARREGRGDGTPALRGGPVTDTKMLHTSPSLSSAEHEAGWYAYINSGGYTEAQERKLVEGLMAAQVAAFDVMLPAGCHWEPGLSEITGPADVDPQTWGIPAMMRAACDEVIYNFQELEQAAIAAADAE